jgi:hypothetical protein
MGIGGGFHPCRFHQLRVKSHLFSGVVKRVHKARGRGERKPCSGQKCVFLRHNEQSTQRDWSVAGDGSRTSVHYSQTLCSSSHGLKCHEFSARLSDKMTDKDVSEKYSIRLK